MVFDIKQYLYTPQKRELIIIQFIRENQGCTRADITRELRGGIISKNTIDRIVGEMIKDGRVHEEKLPRNNKLYLNEDNLLVSVPGCFFT